MGVLITVLYGNLTASPRTTSGAVVAASDGILTVSAALATNQAGAQQPVTFLGAVSYRPPTSAFPACLAAPAPAPATITQPPPPAPAPLSLPAGAVAVATAGELAAAVGNPAFSTIVVTQHITLAAELVIGRALTLQGSCDSRAAASTVSPPVATACRLDARSAGGRALRVSGAMAALNGLIILNGDAGSGNGGGIWCTSGCTLTATDVAVSGCSATSGAPRAPLRTRSQKRQASIMCAEMGADHTNASK